MKGFREAALAEGQGAPSRGFVNGVMNAPASKWAIRPVGRRELNQLPARVMSTRGQAFPFSGIVLPNSALVDGN